MWENKTARFRTNFKIEDRYDQLLKISFLSNIIAQIFSYNGKVSNNCKIEVHFEENNDGVDGNNLFRLSKKTIFDRKTTFIRFIENK